VKAYGNLGYTYRIPTFTDLNYKSPTTIGNSNLEPEKASQEVGLKWNTSNFNLSAAVFNRNSSHLIDYVKWSLRILGKRKTFKMLPPKVLKHNCFIALILMHLLKVTIWLFFYSE
jgi:outer membrane cobalamin receptor